MKKLILFIVCMFVCSFVWGAPSNSVSIPNSFTPNTTISSSEVNSNNNEIQTKYNAHTHTDLTQVGTVTSGVWTATEVATTYGGTGSNFGATASGAIIYFDGTGSTTALADGAITSILYVDPLTSVPGWLTPGGSNQALRMNSDANALEFTGVAVTQVVGVTSGDTTNSTSYVDLKEMEITKTTGAGDVVITFSGTFTNDNTGNITYCILDIDGTDKTESERQVQVRSGGDEHCLSFVWVETVTAASHVFKVQWKVDGNNGTATGVQRCMQLIE